MQLVRSAVGEGGKGQVVVQVQLADSPDSTGAKGRRPSSGSTPFAIIPKGDRTTDGDPSPRWRFTCSPQTVQASGAHRAGDSTSPRGGLFCSAIAGNGRGSPRVRVTAPEVLGVEQEDRAGRHGEARFVGCPCPGRRVDEKPFRPHFQTAERDSAKEVGIGTRHRLHSRFSESRSPIGLQSLTPA